MDLMKGSGLLVQGQKSPQTCSQWASSTDVFLFSFDRLRRNKETAICMQTWKLSSINLVNKKITFSIEQ